ncbi:App1 family protein [Polluticoccus soli]|uniref:App1 family protein n=1 Tax=Polluticoccus soli TaxID=3034150 RepID=UPI0023E317FB|nr:phosphatase domain-containing protein [Flavipsychrobacter sp. JY13-12]
MDWKELFGKYVTEIESDFNRLADRLKFRMGYVDPIQILPYRTYGTLNRLYLKGRVLEDEKIAGAGDKDTILNNLLNMYKRFESDEVVGATIKAVFGEEEQHAVTDNEGYFHFDLVPEKPVIRENLWHGVDLHLTDIPKPYTAGFSAKAEVMIPPLDAEYGIISDIDDTIVRTSATDMLAMARTVFLNNAKTRLPFAGVSEFYKSLQLGRNGKRNNPFFYVSSSPWNMYDLLRDFLDLNEIPAGPLLLRDFGMANNSILKSGGGHMGHKFGEIERILLTYPDLNFVLVGDSGQEDPKIYREVALQFPGRILAIYIRDVQLAEREKIALDISKELSQQKLEMVIVDNTTEAADHAAKTGLIYREAIPAIEQDKAEDKGQLPGKEEATVTGDAK